MAESSDNLKDVYNDIFKINDYFYEGEQGQLILDEAHGSIDKYCDYGSSSGNGKCQNDYLKMASSGIIHLLTNLKNYGLENDKLAEYAILFLSYKLNQNEKNKLTDLNEFYTKYIETNKYYNNKIKDNGSSTYKEIIDTNNDLMNIKEISKFDYPFGILLLLYHVIKNNKLDCKKYSKDANDFVQNFEELNNDSNNIKDSPFSQLLSTISDDYKNLINKYGNKCTNFKSLPELTPKENPVGNSEQPTVLSPEATPSSSSILNTVIPGLSTFAIPIFLGVAYKVNNKELKL
ncbi:CIR protein PIR protein [Plasmodium vinckei vinckei]|uniref:CIR protein PIR protein n=1 Tax=Plasmodium vinckei vinckei TaxID=54757 RepID=A0A449BNS6_PLAVN|nr:CIR protein PIR protein [Plasmodium vinckei vinckei]VEV55116.1 CIR protein PIR protein [Plasmodium vinckei vinckei]